MMIPLLILAVAVAVYAAPACEHSWTAYKDEACIKTFPTLKSYEDAQALCASLDGNPSLVMVKNADMQQFLSNYTEGLVDYIWLGGRYDASSTSFKWENGQPLVYSNWMAGYPRGDIDEESGCIELRPLEDTKNSPPDPNSRGKWAHESCRKRNLVICQKPLAWSLEDAVAEIISLKQTHQQELLEVRERLARVNSEFAAVNSEFGAVKSELALVSSRVVPIGSIYIQYYGQPSPPTLWPGLGWKDITLSYAGLFFRAANGGAAYWGTTQEACAPRITLMEYGTTSAEDAFENPLSFPSSGGYTPFGHVGENAGAAGSSSGNQTWEGLRFYTEDCEIRPRNQAVRIWKRLV